MRITDKKGRGGAIAAPDPQEAAALKRATDAVALTKGATPEQIAFLAISVWIAERTRLSSAHRVDAQLVFDLKNSQMRGFVEAALPAIANTLAHIPRDKPLFELTRDQVVDVALAFIEGARESFVAAGEAMGLPFDDDIRFGGQVAA